MQCNKMGEKKGAHPRRRGDQANPGTLSNLVSNRGGNGVGEVQRPKKWSGRGNKWRWEGTPETPLSGDS